MIPPDQVDEIHRAVRIEEVVGEFVMLKKRGANYIGLCPFHNEKTPSFTVSATKGIFKCFGCGKAGNAVGFLMDHLHITYPEALRWLANKYNISIKERELSDEEKKSLTEKESILILLKFAAQHYQNNLFETDEGKSVALSYLYERGLEEHIIREFGLGYSLNDKRGFTQSALQAQFSKRYLIKSGQCLYKTEYHESEIPETEDAIDAQFLIDRFQARIMFPIHDESGRVLGFGGRNLSADKNLAKYVNSPESPVYHKSEVLYGLYQAKKHIIKENASILAEGYMDVIALHQHGLRNAVASSGTSLTEGQVRKLHRFCEKVIIAFDGDDAGKKAAERAVPMLLEEGLMVYRVSFPDNHDPDSFAKAFGREALLRHIVQNTHDFLEYYVYENKDFLMRGPIERSSFIGKMASWIALIPNDIRRTLYIQELSKKLGIGEEVIQTEVTRLRKEWIKSKIIKEQSPSVLPEIAPNYDNQKHPIEILPVSHADESEILRLLLLYGNMVMEEEFTDPLTGQTQTKQMTLAEFVLEYMSIEQLMFNDPLHMKIFSLYYNNLTEKGFTGLEYFMNFPDDDVRGFITNHVIKNHEVSENWKKFNIHIADELSLSVKALKKSLQSLKEKIISQIIASLKNELKNENLDENEATILLHKIRVLEKERIEINKNLGRSGIKYIPES
ncbi:MAG: DNA primase [Bacteroidia bacterium]|nr:DNA primase [Bacteroidia bacterium]